MKPSRSLMVRPPEGKGPHRCLSCGTTEHMGRRKYCSLECRQRLRQKLDMRIGLVQALNTRYATFYFTEHMVFMDILTYGSAEIFSFFFPRSPGKKPAEDFSRLANLLGDIWWAEKRRTQKRYLASRRVLEQAIRVHDTPAVVKPLAIHIPAVHGASLTLLKLDRTVLGSAELAQTLKSAYRQQAKRNHPDRGGDAQNFRKIHSAYEELMNWAENPVFVRRRGFPDKWFYDGSTGRWVQPRTPSECR
ncbi:MAG: J domain-containing protein [Syntrophales bacterium]|nr:J domain-containing protein [Syntrophales bacterium]MDD4339068.1 J domain-containing protein [Syntrophales bacterium]HOG07782.1 J domain-containing protein [Syntrophales bacterium]HOS78444.1 J domain-containing protein [Syntrophales bacterium]